MTKREKMVGKVCKVRADYYNKGTMVYVEGVAPEHDMAVMTENLMTGERKPIHVGILTVASVPVNDHELAAHMYRRTRQLKQVMALAHLLSSDTYDNPEFCKALDQVAHHAESELKTVVAIPNAD